MTRIVVVLNGDGTLAEVLGDSEVSLQILKEGKDDDAIDAAEVTLDEITE